MDSGITEDQRRFIHGAFLFTRAAELGWKDEGGESPLAYLTRLAYEQGHEDARREAKGER